MTSLESLTKDKILNRLERVQVQLNNKELLLHLSIYSKNGNLDETYKVVFLMHGIEVSSAKIVKNALKALKREDKNGSYILVSPEISGKTSAYYNLGNMFSSSRKEFAYEKSDWTFGYINRLFDIIRNKWSVEDDFIMFGHSAGAQFTHRYILFGDTSDLGLGIVANAGWYTALDGEIKFPYGLKGVNRYLNRDCTDKNLVLLLGTKDTQADKYLRSTKRSNAQGQNRLERGDYFYKKAQSFARLDETKLNWSKRYIEGVGHNGRLMLDAAIKLYLR